MKRVDHHWHISYICWSDECVASDVSRYETQYNKYPTYLITRFLRLDDQYIQIDYRNNKTVISRIEACVLFDIVEVPRALELDIKNPYELLKKVRTLMVFS